MRKGRFTTLLLILIFFAGLSLLLYPSVADYWNSLHQSQAVAEYAEQVANLDAELYDKLLQAAAEFNERLRSEGNRYIITEEDRAEYESLLNLAGNGVMGYIEIPTIDCSLPIYHGVSDSVLQIAIGHLEWSSLPIGGKGTHCVVSGHRGLPSARLFTDLDKLVEGDIFVIRVLDETVTYEVDQIRIVLPEELDDLQIDPEADLCTLVTCTPYGINTHRMLVRGHRIENAEEAKIIRVTADAMQIEPLIMAPLVASPMLFVLLLWLMVAPPKKK